MKKNMDKTTKNNLINYGIVIALFVIVQILSGTGHLSRLITGLLVPLCVYVIAAISLNLVVGFSGELSLGHAGFMCVGAYSSALFSHVASSIPQVPRFILAILIGAAVAAVFGVIIGIPVLRLRGDYLAIVTLAFGEIIKNLINILYVGFDENGLHVATKAANLNLAAGGKQILKGALGISGTGALYKDVKHYFFPIGILLVLLTLFVVQNLVNSRSGRAIMATRDNRIAAESVGIDITKIHIQDCSYCQHDQVDHGRLLKILSEGFKKAFNYVGLFVLYHLHGNKKHRGDRCPRRHDRDTADQTYNIQDTQICYLSHKCKKLIIHTKKSVHFYSFFNEFFIYQYNENIQKMQCQSSQSSHHSQ